MNNSFWLLCGTQNSNNHITVFNYCRVVIYPLRQESGLALEFKYFIIMQKTVFVKILRKKQDVSVAESSETTYEIFITARYFIESLQSFCSLA